jgi:hypothetical protein
VVLEEGQQVFVANVPRADSAAAMTPRSPVRFPSGMSRVWIASCPSPSSRIASPRGSCASIKNFILT